MYLHDLETPALILDKPVFLQNMQTMNDLLAATRLRLRPHYKSHKCAELAHMQVAAGAVGMTCAKLSEAKDLCDSGIEDILIANQIVQPQKIREAAELAAKCHLTVCVDDICNIDALDDAARATGSTIHCLVEYDIGMDRCGVFDKGTFVALAKHILSKQNLTFEGIQAYAGHISHIEDKNARREMTADNHRRLKELMTCLEEEGISVNTLSGGSTGTSLIKAEEDLYTELQAGSYLFMDATYGTLGLPFHNSLFLLTTVVSTRDGVTVVDAGVKTCGVDQGMPVPVGFSAEKIVDNEEHFKLYGPSVQHRVGDQIRLIPGHCCSTVNLHDRIYVVEDDKVVGRLMITGRGFGK